MVLISNPLSINSLSHLLGNCGIPSKIYSTLQTLHSLLLVPDSLEDPVRIFHKSFPDFLMDPEWCTDHRFFMNPLVYHREIMLSCLRVMNKRLKKDICQLGACISLSDVKDLPTQRSTYIGDVLGYACHFWTCHLIGAASSDPGIEDVYVIGHYFCLYFSSIFDPTSFHIPYPTPFLPYAYLDYVHFSYAFIPSRS